MVSQSSPPGGKEKIFWSGKVVSIQPRIRLLRSFDQRNRLLRPDPLGYVSITAINKIFLQNYLFFWLKYCILNHKSKEQT